MRIRQVALSLALVLVAGAHACSSPSRRGTAGGESGSGGDSGPGGKSSGGHGGGSGGAGTMNGGGASGRADANAGASGGEDTADAGAGTGGGDDAAGGAGGAGSSSACTALCPALYALASACQPDDMCTVATSMSGMTRTERLCHGNAIKQVVDTMEDAATGDFTQTVKVLKSDGSTCYTIDVTGNEDGDKVTWKGPDGAMVATGLLSDDGTTITCDGATKEVGEDADCPWVYEGPDDGDCVEGTCN
jgi:hypothetical protein